MNADWSSVGCFNLCLDRKVTLLVHARALLLYVCSTVLILLFEYSAEPLAADVDVRLHGQLSEVLSCMRLKRGQFHTAAGLRQQELERVTQVLRKGLPDKLDRHCYAGFCGPWLEDFWVDDFASRPIEDFGVFVPLFVHWLRFWKHDREAYFRFVSALGRSLNRSFLYVTVSQNDDGVEGRDGKFLPDNVFVVSAGGKGHVPFLLFGRSLDPLENLSGATDYDTVFMGSQGTHPVREALCERLTTLRERFYVGKSDDWVGVYATSKTVLCPRGWGRNSFRMTETVQLGLIPVYVFNDVCWLPYYGALPWEKLGYILKLDGSDGKFKSFLSFLENLTEEELVARRKAIRRLYHSHFTVNGSLRQLSQFLRFGFGYCDLRCAPRMFTR